MKKWNVTIKKTLARSVLVLTLSTLTMGEVYAQMPSDYSSGESAAPAVDPNAPTPDNAIPLGKATKYNNNDPVFRDIAKEFRCPTCTGLSVLESDAGFSVQIKEQVQEQLNLGKNHDQIRQYFTERYGPWILREPPPKGFNILAWAIPIALLCIGPILIWLLVWKRHKPVESRGVRSATVIMQELQDKLTRMKEGVR